MPIYEFLCECGNRFEKLCKMNEKPVSPCPKCGEESRRVMSTLRRGRSSGSSGMVLFGRQQLQRLQQLSCATCH